MKANSLSRPEMAQLLQTPLGTFNHWLDAKDSSPPGCLAVLIGLLEDHAQVLEWLGRPKREKGAPRGRSFQKGNAYRIKKGEALRKKAEQHP